MIDEYKLTTQETGRNRAKVIYECSLIVNWAAWCSSVRVLREKSSSILEIKKKERKKKGETSKQGKKTQY